MKTILASALALGVMTSAAFAGPVKLTAAQMDSVTAGQFTFIQANVALQSAWAGSFGGTAVAANVALQSNSVSSGDDDD